MVTFPTIQTFASYYFQQMRIPNEELQVVAKQWPASLRKYLLQLKKHIKFDKKGFRIFGDPKQ
jgi:hypothetical protein